MDAFPSFWVPATGQLFIGMEVGPVKQAYTGGLASLHTNYRMAQ